MAKKMISPGSLVNTSEGLLSGGAMAALVQQMRSSDEAVVQAAACIGLAIVAAVYCVMRQRAKGTK